MSSNSSGTTRPPTRRADGGELVALLDRAECLAAATAVRMRSYELLDLRRGSVVADVGCGSGRAVAEMTDLGVTALGVDVNAQMIAAAMHRWPGSAFRTASAYALPFADGELHGYRAEKVFHDLVNTGQALAEARRVLRPGGRIVLLGQDWDAFVIDSDDPDLTRAIVHARADAVAAPMAARAYRNLLLDAGFAEVTVEVHTGIFTDTTMLPMLAGIAEAARAGGAISGEQAKAWIDEQTQRTQDDRVFLAVPLFVAAAQRPATEGR